MARRDASGGAAERDLDNLPPELTGFVGRGRVTGRRP